jgi:chlorophyll(ide) b reductase
MNNNIVITGGSSGFGKAMALEFSRKNNNVIVAGRQPDKLMQLAKFHPTITTLQCDVKSKTDMVNLGHYASQVFDGRISHWINNAAICDGPVNFDDISLDVIEDVITTNLVGSLYGIKVAHDHGVPNIYIINGHGSNGMATPRFATYGASKAALRQAITSIDQEWGRGVKRQSKIGIISPGIMKTELTRKIMIDDDMNVLVRGLFRFLSADPETVAKKIVAKILQDPHMKHKVITGL